MQNKSMWIGLAATLMVAGCVAQQGGTRGTPERPGLRAAQPVTGCPDAPIHKRNPPAKDAGFGSPAVPGRERWARDVRRFSSSFWPWFWNWTGRRRPRRRCWPGRYAQRWNIQSEAWDAVSLYAVALIKFHGRVKACGG